VSEAVAEVPEPIKLREFFSEKLQEGFNNQSAGLGAQIVTDWIVLAEVHGVNGPVLRLIDGGQPMWRTAGLLKFGLMDLQTDVLLLNGSEDEDDE
jgi:hypothetical protein